MSKFFGDMLPYEIIMAVMGVVIFLALVFLLVWMVMKKRSIVTLIPFFLISVVMVAFPTLSSVKVGDFIIDIREKTRLVQDNPTDKEAVQQLNEALVKLNNSSKLSNNSEALVAGANAEIALGEYGSASEKIEKAEKINPEANGLVRTKELIKEKVEIQENFKKNIEQLNSAISQLEASPADKAVKDRIAMHLSEIKVPDYVDPGELQTIARSYAIIGQRETSLQVIEKVEPQVAVSGDIGIIRLRDSIQRSIPVNDAKPEDSVRIHNQRPDPAIIRNFDRTIIRSRFKPGAN